MNCNSTRNSVQGLQSVLLLINDTPLLTVKKTMPAKLLVTVLTGFSPLCNSNAPTFMKFTQPHYATLRFYRGDVNSFTADSAKSKINELFKITNWVNWKTVKYCFPMNGHILGFCPLGSKVRKLYINQGFTLGVKGLRDGTTVKYCSTAFQ